MIINNFKMTLINTLYCIVYARYLDW